jgi:hypothetical protein
MFGDNGIILKRFPIGENSLAVYIYTPSLGLRSFIAPDYFKGEKYKLGLLEPFNYHFFWLEEENGSLTLVDWVEKEYFHLRAAKNYQRFHFMAQINKTILSFIKDGDPQVLDLILTAYAVEGNFNFNLIRFWLNLSTLLGFSIEKLNRPGWVNLLTLKGCSPREIHQKGVCIYVSPKVFFLLKRISHERTKPFIVHQKELLEVQGFFYRFFRIHSQ